MLNGLSDRNTRWSNTIAEAPLAMQTSEDGVWRSRMSRLATLVGSRLTLVSNATPAPMPTMNAPATRKFVILLPPPPPFGPPPPLLKMPPPGGPPRSVRPGGSSSHPPGAPARPPRGGA